MPTKKPATSKSASKSKDIVRQALLLGFGLMDLSKEKVSKIVEDIKKDQDITKDEAHKAVDDLFANVEKNRKEVDETMRKHVSRMVIQMGLVTKEDLKKAQGKK